jgi:hypothetical protein
MRIPAAYAEPPETLKDSRKIRRRQVLFRARRPRSSPNHDEGDRTLRGVAQLAVAIRRKFIEQRDSLHELALARLEFTAEV